MKRKNLILILVTAATFLVMAWPVQAAGNVQATLTAERSELTVGDPVQITLEVTHPADYQVIIPKLEPGWGDFEVRGQSQAETLPNADGTETTRQTLTVTLFKPGTFETPPLPLTISDGAGQVTEDSAPPVSLSVIPVLAEGDTSLNDIRPQVRLDLPASWAAIIAGLVLASVVAGGGLWLYRRWHSQRRFAIENRPADQVALDELKRIDGLQLPTKGRFKEHYTLVTDCLRTFVERQFQVHAFDRTTSELKLSLNRSTMSSEHARMFVDLFSDSDFVKFAKLIPTKEEADQATCDARELVELTRPGPELEQSASAKTPSDRTKFQQPVEVTQ
jgi:hypothetical protein